MVNVTLIELHLDDAKLGANTPGGGKALGLLSGSSDEGSSDEAAEESGGGSLLPAVVGLVVLVAVAAVARRRLGGDAPVPELENIEV